MDVQPTIDYLGYKHDKLHFLISIAALVFGVGLFICIAIIIALIKDNKQDSSQSFLYRNWILIAVLVVIGGCTMSALFCTISMCLSRNAGLLSGQIPAI